MKWTLRLFRAFRLILDPHTKYVHTWVEDPPEVAEPGYVYLIGEELNPWSASLVCPCGCGATISLSLIRNDDPRWRYVVGPLGSISLFPSVWRTRGCKSHFSIRNGRVLWATSWDKVAR